MPPTRTRDKATKNKEGNKAADTKRQRYHKKSNPDEPGVQKLKASLRQTRRLLAKDDLAPDVQIQAERKLKSLEADLAKAEIRRKERSMAVRYHKIKFFDKQKVTRKLKQIKRALEAPDLDKKERKKLQKELLKHRIDLNYIINYPKLDKYIALYPSSHDTDNSETDRLREERRAAVRQAMENGEMDAEPEMRKNNDEEEEEDIGEEESDEQQEPEDGLDELTPKPRQSTEPKTKDSKKSERHKPKPSSSSMPVQKLVNVREDDFFDT